MPSKKPETDEEIGKLVYFTKRNIGNGKAFAWVYRLPCPKCKKALMGKPREGGKVKIRSKEYVCPECNYTVEKEEYEGTLTAAIEYTCPQCGNSGFIEVPYHKKKVKVLDEETGKTSSADAIVFSCQKCSAKINITKKMK